MRLYSSVIKLINLHAVAIPTPGGQHGHAAFLDIVRAVDPALSQRLHDTRGKGARQPFTVSPLMELPKNMGHAGKQEIASSPKNGSSQRHGKSEIYLRAGWECWMRVTILDEALFGVFIEHFLNGPARPQVRLGDAHFLVSEILTTPGSHPWAGCTTLAELQTRLDVPAPQKFAFELHTPTSFKMQDEQVETVPYPKLVFGNLAAAWRALTGEDQVRAVETYAEKHLRLVLHRIERKALMLHNHPQLGAVGKVEYEHLDAEDTLLARALNLLADLAFYSGLGRKTPQGMGMVRRVVS